MAAAGAPGGVRVRLHLGRPQDNAGPAALQAHGRPHRLQLPTDDRQRLALHRGHVRGLDERIRLHVPTGGHLDESPGNEDGWSSMVVLRV